MKALINEYLEAKKQLDHYKKLENKLRLEVLSQYFPDSHIGTNNATEGDYLIKGTFKNTISLSKDVNTEWDSLTEIEQACVDFKPSLKMAVYNALEPEEKENLDGFITVKPAMPTLSIKEIEE